MIDSVASFEAGGRSTPSILDPWYKVGDGSQVVIGTELSSPFPRNPVPLKVEVLCDSACPSGGVGAANPGFWGMGVVAGDAYRVEFWVRAAHSFTFFVTFTSTDGAHCHGARATQVQAEPMSQVRWFRCFNA